MKPFIPKQPKHVRERIEAKLDVKLARTLERYCEYLDSDRDYVVSQALDLVFRKDSGFKEWLDAQPALVKENAAKAPSISKIAPQQTHGPVTSPTPPSSTVGQQRKLVL